MALIPGFEHDIYISYANVDNMPLAPGAEPWVDLLRRRLEVRLAQLLGQKPDIWFDQRFSSSASFDDELASHISRSAILLAVISPGYHRSDWCMQELETFSKAARQGAGLVIGAKPRIIKVVKTHIPIERHPPELSGSLGYEFYEYDVASGRAKEFRDDVDDRRYWNKFEDLAQDIGHLIETFLKPPASVPVPPEYSPINDAYDRIVNFARRFGEPHITLAMNAALPLGLTTELVHLIRVNFVNRAPRIAEADLLLSPLCREVGGGLYEMYPEVRELLLAELNEDEEIPESRLEELAEFLMVYATRNLNSARFPELRNFLVAQQWTALARLRPAETAQSLASALGKRLSAQNPAGSLRLAQLARSMSAQLTGQDNVLVYAAGVESLAFGDANRASETFGILGSMSESPAVKSITLPAPADLAQLWPEAAEGLWAEGMWAETQTGPSPLPAYVTLRNKISEGGTPTTQVAWSPDGGLVIGASTEGALRLWDVKTGSRLRSFVGVPPEVNDIAWSPDGRVIATASFDTEVSLWVPESGKLMTRLSGHREVVKSVAWSPDGNRLASASADGAVNLWDFRTGRTLNTLEYASDANSVAWAPAGAYYLVTGYGNGDVIAWDTNSGNKRRSYRGHKAAVNSVAISPNRAIFASASDDGAIRIWRIDEPADNYQITLEGHSQPVSKICFSSTGRLLASRSYDDTVRVWRSPDWRCVAIINVSTSFAGANTYFPVLAFHPSEPLLATCVYRPDEISVLELDEEKLINSSSDIND